MLVATVGGTVCLVVVVVLWLVVGGVVGEGGTVDNPLVASTVELDVGAAGAELVPAAVVEVEGLLVVGFGIVAGATFAPPGVSKVVC